MIVGHASLDRNRSCCLIRAVRNGDVRFKCYFLSLIHVQLLLAYSYSVVIQPVSCTLVCLNACFALWYFVLMPSSHDFLHLACHICCWIVLFSLLLFDLVYFLVRNFQGSNVTYSSCWSWFILWSLLLISLLCLASLFCVQCIKQCRVVCRVMCRSVC